MESPEVSGFVPFELQATSVVLCPNECSLYAVNGSGMKATIQFPSVLSISTDFLSILRSLLSSFEYLLIGNS